jgi:hypothetical protein
MNKQMIGQELKAELAKGYDIIRISRWAFRVYSENQRSLDPSLSEILESLFAMEDDPQFELTVDELSNLAEKLIAEGEKEEFSSSVSEIKNIAIELGDLWLMCPLCQEAWEEHSAYSIVRCPKCNNKLHNPKFKNKKN